jgi:hypothetical protein
LLNSETALGEAIRVGTPEGALLDEAAVDDDENHGCEEAREGRPGRSVAPAEPDHEPRPDRRAG